MGFDEESNALRSTIETFVYGCVDAIEAHGGSASGSGSGSGSGGSGSGTSGLARQARREGTSKILNSEHPLLRLCSIGNGTSLHQFVLSYVRAVSELRFRWSAAEKEERERLAKLDSVTEDDAGSSSSSGGSSSGGSRVSPRWRLLRSLLDEAVRVFIVPIGRNCNDVSSWLASRDGWYRRTIFSTFRTQPEYVPGIHMPRSPSLPSAKELLAMDATTRRMVHDDCVPPMTTMIPRSLQEYAANARQILPISLFRCECWATATTTVPGSYGERTMRYSFSDVQGSVPIERHRSSSTSSNVSNGVGRPSSTRIRDSEAPLVVPFCSRVEIGIAVLLEEYRDESSGGGGGGDSSKKEVGRGDISTCQNGVSHDTWREETLLSKEFHAWWTARANANVEKNTSLKIKFTENDMNGEVREIYFILSYSQ